MRWDRDGREGGWGETFRADQTEECCQIDKKTKQPLHMADSRRSVCCMQRPSFWRWLPFSTRHTSPRKFIAFQGACRSQLLAPIEAADKDAWASVSLAKVATLPAHMTRAFVGAIADEACLPARPPVRRGDNDRPSFDRKRLRQWLIQELFFLPG